MPNHTNPTLALALGLDGGPMREQLGKVAKDCIELDIKQQIGTALTPGFWNGVGQEVEEAVVKGLDDIPISKILVEAWLSAMQFRSYADPEIHPLDLDGVHLRILDGRIRAISLGATKVSASLKLAGKEVKRFPLREFRYDGELELHPPMPIMLPDRYPPAVALPEEARVPTSLAPPSSG